MKPILHKIVLALIYITQLLSLVLFGYIVIAHFLNLLTIDTAVDVRVFELDYLRLLMAIGLSTSIVATLLLIALKKVDYVSFFRQPLREKATYIFITVTLSYFFAVSPHVAVKKELAIFIPVLIVLVAVIPTLLESFMQFEFRDYRHLIASFRAPSGQKGHSLRIQHGVEP
ncbi:hypothetical protein HYS00_05430 [Candidatus Microgenomates bacterium]|nr:hypothetical protein [Candidatus Microgenomates bacterium]